MPTLARAPNYNYFRDYDPSIGRYVESDPIGLRAGPNTFGYVKGMPLSFADPFGLKAQVCCRKIPGVPSSHCFINEKCPRSLNRRTGLQGPPPWGSSSGDYGEIHQNDPFDDPNQSTCGPWNKDPDVNKCVEREIKKYANPSSYSAILGPNSNTLAGTISRACNLGDDAPGFWVAHGWNFPSWATGDGQ